MPLYDFHCPSCGLDFEVSRLLSKADEPVFCPIDKTQAERVFTMPVTFVKGGGKGQTSPAPTTQPAPDWSHHGHSHGPGASGHVH